MSDKKYFVLCGNNCKYEAMTKEQIIAAIAEATGNTPTNIDDAFISKIKEMNKGNGLSFWVGTTAEYNALPEKDFENIIYIKTDDSAIDDINKNINQLYKIVEEVTPTIEKAAKMGKDVLFEGSIPYVVDGKEETDEGEIIEANHIIKDINNYSVLLVSTPINTVVCAKTEENYIKGSYTEYMMNGDSEYHTICLKLEGNKVVENNSCYIGNNGQTKSISRIIKIIGVC